MKFQLRKSDGSLSSDTPEYDKEGKLTKVINENYIITKHFTNGSIKQTKMTELTTLLTKYPNLEYEDGFFYPDSEDDGYILDDKGKPLDAKSFIEEYFEGEEVCTNPNEPDPCKEEVEKVTGEQYVRYVFDSDYSKAFKEITG